MCISTGAPSAGVMIRRCLLRTSVPKLTVPSASASTALSLLLVRASNRSTTRGKPPVMSPDCERAAIGTRASTSPRSTRAPSPRVTAAWAGSW